MRFHKGQRIVCIDSDFRFVSGKESGLTEGKTYYVKSYHDGGVIVEGKEECTFSVRRFITYDEDLSLELAIQEALYFNLKQ